MKPPPPNDPREIFGWMVYDWANSTFPTTVVSALLGPYLTLLAQAAVGENGSVLSLGSWTLVTAKSFFPYCVSASVFLQVLLLPVLGAIADYSRMKKLLMAVFCYVGVAATCSLFFVTGALYPLGGLLLAVANVAFGAATVLCNAFLSEIASEDQRDKVSSRGYALGYLGGGIVLAGNLGLVLGAGRLGIAAELAVRLSLLSAGLWWGGFALITFARLKSRAPARSLPAGRSYPELGWSELGASLRELRRLPATLRYLVAYLLYNDGIQTVVPMATVLLSQELFVARGVKPDTSFLLGLLLMIQFVALLGSLLFERLASAAGTKTAILVSLFGWTGAVLYAWAALHTTTEAWILGAVIALVLGGSQALSRSLFSSMIPAGREASFFGLYEVSDRGTSWIGPALFGTVVALTNSYRHAMLSLVFLFVAGMVVLSLTDTARAIREARGEGGTDLPGSVPGEAI